MTHQTRQTILLRRAWWGVLLLLLLAGCTPAGPEPTLEMALINPTTVPALPTATPLPPPAAATLPPSATPLPTATATPIPSPTPLPLVRLAYPAGWEARLEPLLATLQNSGWQWQGLPVSAPAGALAAGQADLALDAGQEGLPAGARPLAVAIPFTTPWEETSLAKAQEIQTYGNSLAQIVPYDTLTPERKALRIDGLRPIDPGYPLQQPYALAAAAGYEAAAALLAPSLAEAVSRQAFVHIAAAGDINLDRTLGQAINNGRLEYPFAIVAPLFQAADIAVGNLECALGDVGEPADKSYTFRAPPAGAEALAMGGFDVITLANNHAMDYGPEALLQGLGLLHAAGLATIGAGADDAAAHQPAILTSDGLRVAFLGYVHVPVEGRSPFFDTQTWSATASAPGLAWADPARVASDVAAARQQADLVVVVLHSGYEYVPPPSEEQMAAARAAIDAGAALVIGHHAHILQGIEFYNGGVIVYGLANFAFTIDGPPETAILNAWLDKSGVRQIELIPAVVQLGGQPRLADPTEAPLILDTIYRLTNSLNPR